MGPALQELSRLEEAFWELQQAVGSSHTAEAASHADSMAAAAEAAAEGLLAGEGHEQAGGEAERAAAVQGAAMAAAAVNGKGSNGAQELQQAANGAAAADGLGGGLSGAAAVDKGLGAASSAQDDLALHLSLSMLFTCATRVRLCSCASRLVLPCQCGCPGASIAQVVVQVDSSRFLPCAGPLDVPAAAPAGGPGPAGGGRGGGGALCHSPHVGPGPTFAGEHQLCVTHRVVQSCVLLLGGISHTLGRPAPVLLATVAAAR